MEDARASCRSDTLNKILRNNLGQQKGMGKTEEKYGPRQMLIDV
jgi:hypothetical protein